MFLVYLKSHLLNWFWNSLTKSPCMAGYWRHGYHPLQVFLSKTKLNTRKAPCAIAFTDAHPLSWLQVLWTQRADYVLSSSSQLRLSANTNKAGLPLFFLRLIKDTVLLQDSSKVRGRRKDRHLVLLWLSSKTKKLKLPKISQSMFYFKSF